MKYRFVLSALALTLLILVGAIQKTKSGDEDFDKEVEEIIIRKIGHEILLLSGDNTSRVMPVEKLNEFEYEIFFESPITFSTTKLVETVQPIIASSNLPQDYRVNVKECISNKVFYGYSVSRTKERNINTCRGRDIPPKCYFINIRFQQPLLSSIKSYVFAGTGILSLIVLYIGFAGNKKRQTSLVGDERDIVQKKVESKKIGNYHLINDELHLGEEIIALSSKESNLLTILANNQNQITERSQLQKEVWEDKGVIVGRSLDMFISKLRKKLEKDDSVKIVNIHGKGYKLEILS